MKKAVFVHGFVCDKSEFGNHSFGVLTFLKIFGTITLEECGEIFNRVSLKVAKQDEYLTKIEIDLSLYEEYADNGAPVFASEENPNTRIGPCKTVTYYKKENMMRIFESHRPIYENRNGVICTDITALCDTLL